MAVPDALTPPPAAPQPQLGNCSLGSGRGGDQLVTAAGVLLAAA
ncbi:hypothetical protein [Streptomyces sp. MCA2]|nr:hypothetical protein [Streptomyces sp. MCA2]